MSGTMISSAGLDVRRKQLLFRAWHRGMREMDLIFGRFADAEVATLSDAEMDAFEALLEPQDQEVFSWISGAEPTPPEHDTALFRRICAFHHASGAAPE